MRYTVDEKRGFPDRIGLRDVDMGDNVLLVNFTHQSALTPYRATHPIYVREGERQVATIVNVIPESLRLRTLSLRAFDADNMMVIAVADVPYTTPAQISTVRFGFGCNTANQI